MVYIDPKTDFSFKRIFGSKETLISFINAALKLKNKRCVESVEVKNPYQVRHLPVENRILKSKVTGEKISPVTL